MRKADMVERLISCLPIIHRSGIKEINTQAMMDTINHLDGPGISKRVKWFRALEAACVRESHIWKDMTPTGWENLKHISPGAEALRDLKTARAAVKNAWRSA